MNKRTILKYIVAEFIFFIILAAILKKSHGRKHAKEFSIPAELKDFLQTMKRDAFCRNQTKGFGYFYLASTGQCAYCGNVCDVNNKKDYIKKECEQECQDYTALMEIKKEIHKRAELDKSVQEAAQIPGSKGLIDRMKELEKRMSLLEVLGNWRKSIDASVNLATLNVAKFQDQLKRVEKEQNAMIEELQDAMDAVELTQKMILIWLTLGCLSLFVTISIWRYYDKLFGDDCRNDSPKTKFV